MAKIGQYYLDSQPAPISGVKVQAAADPNAYGANVGKAMEGLAGVLTQRGQEIQDQKDTQDVLNAETGFKLEMGDMLRKDGGYLTRVGREARDMTVSFDQD